MKRIVVPALALAAALAGCTSTARQPQTPSTPTPPGSTAPNLGPAPIGRQSTAELQARTLKLADLPFGWALSPSSTEDSVTATCDAINSNAGKTMPAHTEADFEQSEEGPFAEEFLTSGSAQQVQAAWTSFQTAAKQCSPSPHLSPEPFPSYGDATYALGLTASEPGMNLAGDAVLIRRGQVLVEVVVFGIGGVPASLVQQVIGTGLAKV